MKKSAPNRSPRASSGRTAVPPYKNPALAPENRVKDLLARMTLATIGFALKSGLALGSASFLWIMVGFFNYDTNVPDAVAAIQGYRVCSGLMVGVLFTICTILLAICQLNKQVTLQMADELAARRNRLTLAPTTSNPV